MRAEGRQSSRHDAGASKRRRMAEIERKGEQREKQSGAQKRTGAPFPSSRAQIALSGPAVDGCPCAAPCGGGRCERNRGRWLPCHEAQRNPHKIERDMASSGHE